MDRTQITATVIDALRAHVSQPSTPSYLYWIYSLHALDPPTQAVIFQLKSPDVAFLFLAHIEGRREMECWYEGPILFSGALKELPKAYEKFREIELPPPLVDVEGRKTLAEVMESALLIFFENMGSELYKIGAGGLLPSLSKAVAILIFPRNV